MDDLDYKADMEEREWRAEEYHEKAILAERACLLAEIRKRLEGKDYGVDMGAWEGRIYNQSDVDAVLTELEKGK